MNSIWNLLKYEFFHFARIERNKGLFIYLLGLPCIPYVLFWTSNASDVVLGVGVLSISAVNIFYGPQQFVMDQRYYEGLFIKNFDFTDFVKGKLIFIQIANTIMFLIQVPLLLLFFDLERFMFALSVFLYSIGIASPATILLSGLNFRFVENSFSKKYNMNNFKLSNLLFGIIPFIPGCLLVVMFSTNFVSLVFLNTIMGLIICVFCNRICRFTAHNILNKKFLC
jgi:hypothetical protein